MFLHSAFIEKNTPELREYLENLGYGRSETHHIDDECLFTNIHTKEYEGISYYYKDFICFGNKTKVIDCENNEELFKAIVAIRDDSDYMQWFITEFEQRWVNQGAFMPKGSFELCLIDEYRDIGFGHKASLEKLIKHFKNK